MLFMVLSRSYSLYSGYFIPLCLCDLSFRCFRIHSLCTFAIKQRSCLSWGIVQGVSWESFLSLLVLFIFWYSPTLHIRDFHVRYYRTHRLFYSERTVSVCIVTLYSVFVLCFFTPHTFGGLYIWRAIYIWRTISVWRALRSSKAWIILTLSIPAASKMASLIFRDQNDVFRDIHFVCVYTPCLYTRYT